MCDDMTLHGLSACATAQAQGVTASTARKWLGRFPSACQAGMANASIRSPRLIESVKTLATVALRHRFTQLHWPQDNGKAKCLIRRCSKPTASATGTHVNAQLRRSPNHRYKHHRSHQGIGGVASMS